MAQHKWVRKTAAYFGGAAGGAKISRFRPGSGFGFGLGAFFTSFLPLSLLPMRPSMTQMPGAEKSYWNAVGTGAPARVTNRSGRQQALSNCARSACISRSEPNESSAASRIAAAPPSAGRSIL